MLSSKQTPRSAREQLKELKLRSLPSGGRIVPVTGIDCEWITNPSIPFISDGEEILAVRADPGGDLPASYTCFCRRDGDGFRLIEDAPVMGLEDPFVANIGGKLVLGGVRVIIRDGAVAAWVTDFYIGDSIRSLKYLFTGPWHMKDIRLVELPGGRVGVFSRPQGQRMLERYGCIAQIGFTIFDRLEDISAERIESAPFLEGLFLNDEWGGANQPYLLDNGLVGLVGHKAWGECVEDEHMLHYCSMAFAVDPANGRFTEPSIICARECFAPGPSLSPKTRDVTFTAGIVRRGEKADLYTGLSDCRIGHIEIEDPLRLYEGIQL